MSLCLALGGFLPNDGRQQGRLAGVQLRSPGRMGVGEVDDGRVAGPDGHGGLVGDDGEFPVPIRVRAGKPFAARRSADVVGRSRLRLGE